MKSIYIILAGLFFAGMLHAQIPNSSFEEWESIMNYEEPVSWSTNQDTNFNERVFKDTLATDGAFSLKVINDPTSGGFTDCTGRVETEASFDQPIGANQSLYFYVLSQSDNDEGTVFLKMNVKLYDGTASVGNYEWSTEEPIEAFQMIEVPLSAPQADSISIDIFGGAQNGPADGCIHRSISWLDELFIDESDLTSTDDLQQQKFKIYPNPARGRIQIEGDLRTLSSYSIHNLLGNTVKEGALKNNTIELEKKGFYFLILKTESGERIVQKVLNQPE